MQYPKQAANVYAEQLDDELCVYDWEQKQMHTLNPTAALVWEQCDGKTDPAQMTARLESELNVPNADKLVALSLKRLEKARLLEGTAPSQTQRTITRRKVLKMAGIGLALLPVVSSIALPSATQAQSVFCYDDRTAYNDACGSTINALGAGAPPVNSCEECYNSWLDFANNCGGTLNAVYYDGQTCIGCGLCP